MGWSGWSKDSLGPGEVNTKESVTSDGTRESHTMRTADNAKTGSRDDHSHVVVRETSDGTTSAHGHGIRGGERTSGSDSSGK